MNNKCQFLRIRTKNYLKYAYCTHFKAPTSTNECSVCGLYSRKQMFVKSPKKVLKTNTHKKTKYKNKQKINDSKRYSIITDDLTKCIECGLPFVELHEVFYGTNREKSKLYGLIIPLCKKYHHQGNLIGIHQDKALDLKWKKIAQQSFMDTYGLKKEDFIKVFGRNYMQ